MSSTRKGPAGIKKKGVRIAVGHAGASLIIALPGPNDEVKAALEVLFKELSHHPDKYVLAEKIAGTLREVLQHKNSLYNKQFMHPEV